jgi:hypothetical protein
MTHAPISEDGVPFAVFALERLMFIRALEKACWDLSVGRSRRSSVRFIFALARRLCRWAHVPPCRPVGLGQDHRDLPRSRMGPRGGLSPASDLGEICHRQSGINGGWALPRGARRSGLHQRLRGRWWHRIPCRGMKKSGHGREKGFEALYELAAMKTLAVKHG